MTPEHDEPVAATPAKLLMVAVDGGEPSTWAAQVAADLARPLRADVVLVHVMDLNSSGASEIAFDAGASRAELLRRADDIFAAALSHFPHGAAVQRLLREGDPGKEVVASAAEWGADLVVMGTHGRGRLATFLLGSTAEAVVRGAHCPVVTVAHDARHPPSNGRPSVALAPTVF